jgi:hypothetical protein
MYTLQAHTHDYGVRHKYAHKHACICKKYPQMHIGHTQNNTLDLSADATAHYLISSTSPQIHKAHTLFFSIRKTLLISRSLHRDDTKTLKHFRPLYNEDTRSHTKDLKKERHNNNTQSED